MQLTEDERNETAEQILKLTSLIQWTGSGNKMNRNILRLSLGMLVAVLLLASFVITFAAFLPTATTEAAPPGPETDCSGCGWRGGNYCYDCRNNVYWECMEYWDHCVNPPEWRYCYCMLSGCTSTGIPCEP